MEEEEREKQGVKQDIDNYLEILQKANEQMKTWKVSSTDVELMNI